MPNFSFQKIRAGKSLFVLLLALGASFPMNQPAFGQAVAVTATLDKSRIGVGETATLHVYGQIVAAKQATTAQIFSWYVDLLNSSGTTAQIQANGLLKPASDNLPNISSPGSPDGANQRGIYDTFMNKPGAGHDAPVELFSVPILGVAPGTSTLQIRAGTGVSNLSSDFLVAPLGGGDPLVGGDYTKATIQLEVASGTGLSAKIASQPLANGQLQLTISFTPVAGKTHTVEFRPALGTGPDWQALPGAPHNSGSVTDTNTAPQRFYRIRVQ